MELWPILTILGNLFFMIMLCMLILVALGVVGWLLLGAYDYVGTWLDEHPERREKRG